MGSNEKSTITDIAAQEQDELEYKKGDTITIAGITMQVCEAFGKSWLSALNGAIFTELQIENPTEYIKSVVGYTPENGSFPMVQSIEDLNKVIFALKRCSV